MDFPRSPTSRLAGVPPSDRRAGHPGLRGRIAGLVALGAVPTLALSPRSSWSSGGGGGGSASDSTGSFSYSFNLGARSLAAELALTTVAGLLIVAAAILWLTAREQGVLERIARGYLYKEVAQMLGVSTRTIETHVSAVLRKLHLSNRHQLARWATEHKLID